MIRARIPAQPCAPTRLQHALAYIATGSLPPLPHVPPIVLDSLISFAVSTAACLALGVLIGRGIVQ
ncbi:hypothetical protein MHZ93_06095 [Roseomonas sp. ACRSG]|nr:hypothetical protein [Roseomonas sp. ACRSG]